MTICAGGMLLLLRYVQLVLQLFASSETIYKHSHDVHIVLTVCHLSLLCHALT